ncbi:MAG: hypothetical protein VX500_12460, partial [Planctomycetota bacterium]|nr:hypothetical protein [Planctomycetota bacterium]
TFALAICIGLFADETTPSSANLSTPAASGLPSTPASGGGFKPTRIPTTSPPASLPKIPETPGTPVISPAPEGESTELPREVGGSPTTMPSLPATLLGPPKDSAPATTPSANNAITPATNTAPTERPPALPFGAAETTRSAPRGLLRSQPITSQSQPATESQPNLPNRVIEGSNDRPRIIPAASLEGERQLGGQAPLFAPPSSIPETSPQTAPTPPPQSGLGVVSPNPIRAMAPPSTTEATPIPQQSHGQTVVVENSAVERSRNTDISLAPNRTGTQLAKSFLENTQQLSASMQVQGTPLSLVEALSGSLNTTQRKLIIQRYWRVAIANLKLTQAILYREKLGSLTAVTSSDQLQLSAASSLARSSIAAKRLQLQNAQFDLIESMGRGTIQQMPTDSPYVGCYRTNFEKYAQTREMPMELTRIHHTLPMMLELMESRAETIAAIGLRTQSGIEAYQAGMTKLSDLLRLWETQQREGEALLESIQLYNHKISVYALTVAPQGLPAQLVVPMLIKSKRTSLAAGNRDIHQTNFESNLPTTREATRSNSTWRSIVPR